MQDENVNLFTVIYSLTILSGLQLSAQTTFKVVASFPKTHLGFVLLSF